MSIRRQYTISDFLEARSAAGPSFSASGRRLAYLANLSGTFQAYVAEFADDGGGAPSAGRQVTAFDDVVGQVTFSPVDDDLLLFSKDAGGNERHQLYLLGTESGQIRQLTTDLSAAHRFGGWSRDGRFIAYASYKRNQTDHDIYVFDLESGDERMVFDLGGWCESFGFSPSGRYLVVSKSKAGGFLDTELFLVDAVGQEPPRLLTPHDAKEFYSGAQWLPDESGFWTVTDADSDHAGAALISARGDSNRERSKFVFDGYSVEDMDLTDDGGEVAVSVNADGCSRIYRQNPVSGLASPIEIDLPRGQAAGLTWSRDGSKLALAISTYGASSNVWIWVRTAGNASAATAMPMGVPADSMVEPSLIKFRSFDGLEIPAFVFMPESRADGPLPAVVYIHGGPEGQFRPGYNPVIQYFVHRGYAVIAPNVRGSDGYGKKYLALDDRFKRMDSVRDLEGLYRWIERDGRIDARRVALMGGSYGGYMVLAGLAFQPTLWAAGVDIVGIASLVTFLENTSAYRRSVREAEYGYLATDRDFLESVSPLSRADDIRAPLLIIHGANDPRVPLSEAQQIRDRLAARGVHVELLVYEDEGHGLAKLKNRLDAYPRVAAFLDRVLVPGEAGDGA